MALEATPPFELRLPKRPERFDVQSLRGREELSKLYRLELTVTTHAVDEGLAAALLGEPATLTLFDAGRAVRAIHGRVARVEAHGLVSHGRQGLRLTLAPSLAALRRRRTRRIFQDQSTTEILAVLAAEHGAACRAAVQRELPKRAYAVQYDETDYAFAARLLAEDGLFFFFEHPLDGDREVLVVGDRGEDYPPIHGSPRLRFERAHASGVLAPTEDQVTSFVPRARVRSARVRVTGHDFRRPDAALGDAAGALGTCTTFDEHEGSYEDDLGPRPASIRLDEERARAVVTEGASFCRRLAPGHVFELAQHDYGWLDRRHVVTSVDHEGYGPELVPPGRATYQCRFEAAPASVVVRPRRRAARTRQVAETAVVVGPPGQEIHADPHARVKVRFHWEHATPPHHGTCWLRVVQPWSGAGFGAQFIPRVGTEVVVTFLSGDVDRPVVSGSLYDATHPPPFPLPEHRTKSGFRSWSTPHGTGGNEISFEDAAGSEQLALHARRDYDETVEHNRTSRVRGAHVAHVDGGSTTRVGEDAYDEVMGRRTSRVHGDFAEDVGGRLARSVGGDAAVTVRGASTLTVEKGESVEVRGDRAVMVGTPGACAQSDHYVHGSASIGAAERLVLRAQDEITLVCGASSLVLTPGKIVLRAPTVEIAPKDALECSTGKGPSVTLTDEVEVLTKRFRMFTEAAALEVDRDFKANGEAIQLGYDPSAPRKDRIEAAAETKPLALKLTDYYFIPYANRPAHVMVDGRRYELETDGDGILRLDVPRSARQAIVRLWLDAYPEGRQRSYTVKLRDELPPYDSVRGVKTRLMNLGYYQGPLDGIVEDDLRAALGAFQADFGDSHALDVTSEIDDATAAALEDVHRNGN